MPWSVLQNIWWFLVLIGVMILIHELGHYWAARFFDVKVETFSFGFGPRLFGFKKGETDFRVAAILFGGYVKMAGEQPGDENAERSARFLAKPRWQRLIIAFAGPADEYHPGGRRAHRTLHGSVPEDSVASVARSRLRGAR